MAHVTYTLLHRRGGVTLHISEAWAWQVVVTLQRSCFGGNERQVDFHSLSDSPPGALLSHLVCEQILMSDCEQGGSGWVGAIPGFPGGRSSGVVIVLFTRHRGYGPLQWGRARENGGPQRGERQLKVKRVLGALLEISEP